MAKIQDGGSPTSTQATEFELASQRCYLLDHITGEIRNRIYEFTFEAPSGSVDLLQARPPTCTLLLTCHQIYDEAKLLYEEFENLYWKKTKFRIKFDGHHLQNIEQLAVLADRALSRAQWHKYGLTGYLRGRDIARISELDVIVRLQASPEYAVQSTYREGVWCLQSNSSHAGPFKDILIAHQKAREVEEAGFRTMYLGFARAYEAAPINFLIREPSTGVDFIDLSEHEIELLKAVAGKTSLQKDEIIDVVMEVSRGMLDGVFEELSSDSQAAEVA